MKFFVVAMEFILWVLVALAFVGIVAAFVSLMVDVALHGAS